MALSNVALTDTVDVWRIRTNQMVIILNGLETTNANSAYAAAGGAHANANVAFAHANLARNFGNTVNVIAVSAYNFANTINVVPAFNAANTAFTQGNNAYNFANTVLVTAQAAFANANTTLVTASAAFANANSTLTTAIAAFNQANNSNITAISAYAAANAAGALANNSATAIAAFDKANAANLLAFTANANVAAKAGALQVEFLTGVISGLSNKDWRLAPDIPYGGTIIRTVAKAASNTCNLIIKIAAGGAANGNAIGGGIHNVNNVRNSITRSANNTFAANDDIILTIANNSNCVDLSWTIIYTRTLVT